MPAQPIALAGACLALVLAACSPLPLSQPVEHYRAELSSAQVVPPVRSAGSGRAELRLDRRSGLLHWQVRYAGLSGPLTAAYLHGPAGPGQNAPALVPLQPSASPLAGQLRLSPEQATQLESGQWYVSLQTAAHPAGELRGQLRHRVD